MDKDNENFNEFEIVNLFKYLDLVKTGVKKFEGSKKYIATGSLKLSEIIDFEEVTYDSRPSRSNMEFEVNDIIFAKMKDTEKVFLINEENEDNLYSTGFAGLRINNNDKLLYKYVFYWLKSSHFQKEKNNECTGATQKAINNKNLKKLKIPVPSILTQHKIVAVLEKAENLKLWRDKASELTDEYLKSIFIEMFGDPNTNKNGWEIVKFKDLIIGTPQNGLYKNASFYRENGEGSPILRIDSFYQGKIENIQNLKRLECTKNEIKQFRLENGDIIINRVNSIEYLGKCALVSGLIEPTVYESNMMRIKVDSSKINNIYLTKFLLTPYLYNQIISKAKKAVNQASINQKDVNSFNIIVPPLDLQNQFAELVQNVEKIKDQQNKSKIQINNLFNTFMQKAFKGELLC